MSRRKQQNPKSISKGSVTKSTLSPTSLEESDDNVLQQEEDEEFELGYGKLMVDEESRNHDKSEEIAKNIQEVDRFHNGETSHKSEDEYLCGDTGLSGIVGNSGPDILSTARTSEAANVGTSYPGGASSVSSQGSSTGEKDGLSLSEYTSMTRGVEDTEVLSGSDATQLTSHHGNSSMSRPRQHTPSKTRRKSDKIVPVMDDMGSKKYICPVCQQDMFSDGELTKHIRSHNAHSALNTCKICNKVLSSQSSLDRHMLVHSGERPFKCKVCGMAFTTNGNMHRHSRIHDKEPGIHNSPTSPVQRQTKTLPVGISNKSSLYRNYPSIYPGAGSAGSHLPTKRKSSTEGDSDYEGSVSMAPRAKRYFLGVEDTAMMGRDRVELGSPNKTPPKDSPEEPTPSDYTLQCPVCLKPFLCRYGLETHWDTCHPDEPSLCQLCHTAFPSTQQVYVHYMLMHAGTSALEPEREHLAELSQLKENNAANSAETATTGFHELGSMTDFSSARFAHIAKAWCEKNQRKPSSQVHNFHCRKCGHAFPCAESLINHLKHHPAEASVTCKACDVNFTTKEQFENHVIQHNTKHVVDSYSRKIGTDDNDIQDMVSQPEFMLVLGLKSTSPTAMTDKIHVDLKKAVTDKKIPTGTKVKKEPLTSTAESSVGIKPMVIQPIQQEVIQSKSYLTNHNQTCLSPQSVVSPHHAFPPPRIVPPMLLSSPQHSAFNRPLVGSLSRSTSPGSDISRATDEGGAVSELHEIVDSEEEQELERDSHRPYQCVICEYAFCTKSQCEAHCRHKHGLKSLEDFSGAVLHNIQQPDTHSPQSGQTSWYYKPLICSLCKNGFSNKENCLKHLVKQHRVHGAVSESYLLYNNTKRQEKSTVARGMRYQPRSNNPMRRQGNWQKANENRPSIKSERPALNGQVNHGTYITSPPNIRLQVATEQSETDEDQPLDFSMKKKLPPAHSVKSVKKPGLNYTAANNVASRSGNLDQPMDLTVKTIKEEPMALQHMDRSYNSVYSGHQVAPAHQNRMEEGAQSMSSRHVKSSSMPQVNLAPSSKTHPFLCHQCPASFSHQMALERHRVSKHPQSEINKRKLHYTSPQRISTSQSTINRPKQSHSQPPSQTSPSIYESRRTPTRDIPAAKSSSVNLKESSSDSELSSVSRMLDATSASKFKQFLSPGPLESTTEINEKEAAEQQSIDLTDRDNPENSKGYSRRQSPSLQDESYNGKDDQPIKRKRNSYSDSPHKLQCLYCPRAFPWISSLNRHILTHTGQKPYKCPECTVTFSTKSNRERHMVRKHGLDIHEPAVREAMEKPYKCELCQEDFTGATEIEKHYHDCHPSESIPEYIVQQAHCEAQPSSGAVKLDPDELSTMSGDYSEGPNSSLMDFEDEEEDEHDEGSLHSLESSSVSYKKPHHAPPPSNTPSPISLLNKPTTNTSPHQSIASIPDTSIEVPEYLGKINPERDNYNVDRITQCWKCLERFDSRKMLLRHLKEHNIDSSFKCYLCDASYETREDSLEHTIEKHPHDWVLLREKNKCYSIREYSCNMDKLVLEMLDNLGLTEAALEEAVGEKETHQTTEEGEEAVGGGGPDEKPDSDYAQRKVFCSFCVKRFWSLQDLRRHMRSHTGERPFECDICQKRFTLKHSMMRHRRKHTPAELAASQKAGGVGSPAQSESEEESVLMGEPSTGEVRHGLKVALFSHMTANSNRTSTQTIAPDTPKQKTQSADAEATGDNDDMLQNLLGIDSDQIDQLLASGEKQAAEMLGLDDKAGN